MGCTLFLSLHDYRMAAWVREGKESRLVVSAFDQCRVLEEKTCR